MLDFSAVQIVCWFTWAWSSLLKNNFRIFIHFPGSEPLSLSVILSFMKSFLLAWLFSIFFLTYGCITGSTKEYILIDVKSIRVREANFNFIETLKIQLNLWQKASSHDGFTKIAEILLLALLFLLLKYWVYSCLIICS